MERARDEEARQRRGEAERAHRRTAGASAGPPPASMPVGGDAGRAGRAAAGGGSGRQAGDAMLGGMWQERRVQVREKSCESRLCY